MPKRKKMRPDFKPQVLSQVLDTIASMRDTNGSPPQKIMQRLMAAHKVPAKTAELVLKKALRSGVRSGLIKEVSGGKYKLGMDKKDYQVFKKFQKLESKVSADLPLRQVRRRRSRSRRRRRGRRSRRRRRRHSAGEEKKNDDEEGDTWSPKSNSDVEENKDKKKHSSDTKRRTKQQDSSVHDVGRSSSRTKSSKSNKDESKYDDDDYGDEKDRIHDSDLSFNSDHCLYRSPVTDHHDTCQHHGYDPNNYS